MAQLVIDIGNSRTKLAVFQGTKLLRSEKVPKLDTTILSQFLNSPEITHSIISSVNDEITGLEDLLKEKTHYIRFSALLQTGIVNNYKSPATLGLDRLAGILGARSLFPKRNCLVIDAGTCITYDAIDKDGVYEGGSISPGLKMRLKAMHNFTGRLPEVELIEYNDWQGYDTMSAMLSGVVNGSFEEVKGFIEIYNSKYSELQVVLCGGDSIFFDYRLKNSIFAHALKTEPDLVLIGLNEVIQQND
ncbi:type III pantothenate kinase [Daejeonella rubra]|uniref:Type III pantothenate kinase n=1 Tax=Daejeonella rubra TaxID=990371 RepID=A0A1G9YFQ3_9SPHI|nr:type III pantothenate kinase [Daejeonella rubra]SDN07386.1 type III pantothenate kinase [Daejeonella rubra]